MRAGCAGESVAQRVSCSRSLDLQPPADCANETRADFAVPRNCRDSCSSLGTLQHGAGLDPATTLERRWCSRKSSGARGSQPRASTLFRDSPRCSVSSADIARSTSRFVNCASRTGDPMSPRRSGRSTRTAPKPTFAIRCTCVAPRGDGSVQRPRRGPRREGWRGLAKDTVCVEPVQYPTAA